MIRIVIVEDEIPAQELITLIIKEYKGDKQILGIASNVNEAATLISKYNPNLVFMDVQLGDKTGFDLLDSLEGQNFKLIMTTAYEKYALKSYKYNAIEYILKPYNPKELHTALEKVEGQLIYENILLDLKNSILSKNNTIEKLTISSLEGIDIIDTNQIIRLESELSYTHLYLEDDIKLMASKGMAEIKKQLPSPQFFQTHVSHIVNVNFVRKIAKAEGGYIIMKDGSTVPLARRRRNEFISLFQ